MIIGVGTDILDCRRLQKSVERQGQRFLNKLFTENEHRFCDARKVNPFASYGTTFAAKEATLKAIGDTHGIRWHDIEVLRLPDGKPVIQLHNIAHEKCLKLAEPANGYNIFVSLTDEPPYVQAMVIITQSQN